MKPTRLTLALLSLPLLGLAGAALAQQGQTVTLYGVADLGMTYTNKPSLYQVMSNVTPRFGLRGSEDVGGGFRVEFQIEQEVKMDTSGGAFADRQGWVGIAGVFGQVRLGRTKSLYDDLGDRLDPFQNNGLVGIYTTPVWRVDVAKSRISNGIQWHSPNWQGLRVAAQYAADEVNGGKNGYGGRVIYTLAGFEFDAAYDAPAVTTANAPFPKAWVVGGSYRFEPVKFSIAYGEGDTKVATRGVSKGTTVGVQGYVGAGTINAVYGRLDSEKQGLKVDVYGLGYEYALSKRTTLYTMASYDRVTTVSGINCGMTHRF